MCSSLCFIPSGLYTSALLNICKLQLPLPSPRPVGSAFLQTDRFLRLEGHLMTIRPDPLFWAVQNISLRKELPAECQHKAAHYVLS